MSSEPMIAATSASICPRLKKSIARKWASGDARAKLRSGFDHNGLASAANVARRARVQVRAAPFGTGCRCRRLSAGDTIDVLLALSGEGLCVGAWRQWTAYVERRCGD